MGKSSSSQSLKLTMLSIPLTNAQILVKILVSSIAQVLYFPPQVAVWCLLRAATSKTSLFVLRNLNIAKQAALTLSVLPLTNISWLVNKTGSSIGLGKTTSQPRATINSKTMPLHHWRRERLSISKTFLILFYPLLLRDALAKDSQSVLSLTRARQIRKNSCSKSSARLTITQTRKRCKRYPRKRKRLISWTTSDRKCCSISSK